MDNLTTNNRKPRCSDGDHAFKHEYIEVGERGEHVFTCEVCGYSILPKTIVNNQPFKTPC